MATKAKLTILLKADETVVAESDDATLWQRVLAAMQGGASATLSLGKKTSGEEHEAEDSLNDRDGSDNGDKAVQSFAKKVGVPVDVLVGALSPSREPPYMHLDHHCWAQMKKDVPKRGPGSISATGMASTLLALWFKEAKIDVQPTQALAAEVLGTIDVRDPNASRGIKNTKWLQGRSGGAVVVNAAEFSRALEVTRAFCTKSWAGAISA